MTLELAAVFVTGCFLSAISTYVLVSRFEKGSASEKAEVLDDQLSVCLRELTEQQVLNASLRERLEGREAKISELELLISNLRGTLEQERTNLISTRDQISRLETTLSEQQQQAEEKLTLLKDAKESLHDGFKNLANEIF